MDGSLMILWAGLSETVFLMVKNCCSIVCKQLADKKKCMFEHKFGYLDIFDI
jgi:hypothetical protein